VAERIEYEAAVARNVAVWRAARRLNQRSLATRMTALGFEWRQQTVGEIEQGKRLLKVGELFGLAWAFETTLSQLLASEEPFAPPDASLGVLLPNGVALPINDVSPIVCNGNTHAVTWDGDTPVYSPRVNEINPGSSESSQQPIVAAIVTSELGVLVGRRNDGKPPWTFIAGEQDAVKDELPQDTAIREVKEETGLRIQAGDVIGERVHPQTGRTMIYLAATPTHGTDVFVGDRAELAEVRWVGLAEADKLLPGMFGPVREYLATMIGTGSES
jgi:8-oxo-dGTP diphosphatase